MTLPPAHESPLVGLGLLMDFTSILMDFTSSAISKSREMRRAKRDPQECSWPGFLAIVWHTPSATSLLGLDPGRAEENSHGS
jgi:hypothetical protein